MKSSLPCGCEVYCAEDATGAVVPAGVSMRPVHRAASDLLASLEETIEVVEAAIVNARNRRDYPELIRGLERMLERARAAIAKAKGRAA